MEEIIPLIFQGCKLVKELEQSLPNSANQPSFLVRSCEEIIRVFGSTRERLHALERESHINLYGQVVVQGEGSHHHHHGLPPPMQAEMGGGSGGGVQEWLRISQAMDMVVHAQGGPHHGLPENSRIGGLEAITGQELGGGNVDVLPMEVADLGRGSSLQRPRRRNEAERKTMRVPAPRMGNTEVPPEDGYTWRKYGQKEILGSRFPRGYYRCTHQKLYDCPAKKQVQRLDNDPYTFEVTYRGDHTCTMSSTAPSISPPPPLITSQSPSTTSVSLTHNWLSMDIKSSGEGTSTNTVYSMYRDHLGLGGPGPSGSGGGGAGPSTISYVDYQGLADFADVIFNSGSSSNNSMELIFPTMEEDKWEGGDKKN